MTGEKPLTAAELPPLREGQLDAVALAELFADYVSCAEVLEVMEKGAATARAAAHCGGVGALLAGLLEGRVRAAQVRYRYQGEVWSDTIVRAAAGYRVVRAPLAWMA